MGMLTGAVYPWKTNTCLSISYFMRKDDGKSMLPSFAIHYVTIEASRVPLEMLIASSLPIVELQRRPLFGWQSGSWLPLDCCLLAPMVTGKRRHFTHRLVLTTCCCRHIFAAQCSRPVFLTTGILTLVGERPIMAPSKWTFLPSLLFNLSLPVRLYSGSCVPFGFRPFPSLSLALLVARTIWSMDPLSFLKVLGCSRCTYLHLMLQQPSTMFGQSWRPSPCLAFMFAGHQNLLLSFSNLVVGFNNVLYVYT